MAKAINLLGKRFGYLTVIGRLDSITHSGKTRRVWECVCDCGVVVSIIVDKLLVKTVNPKSCGCYYKNTFYKNTLYTRNSYNSMLGRCYNEKATGYENYGGRGIKVCDRWLNSFENFLEDMGERPSLFQNSIWYI